MNPLSVLENSFNQLKDFIDKEMQSNEQSLIDVQFLNELKSETQSLLNICKTLNEDKNFVHKINGRIDTSKINAYYKTEQIFLSEIIKIYDKNQSEDNPKAKFVLAYYYDVLRNNHFAEESSLPQLNLLIKSAEFSGIISRIKQQNLLSTLDKSADHNLLVQILSEVQHEKKQDIINHFNQYCSFSAFPQQEFVITTEAQAETSNPKVEEVNPNVSYPPEDDTLEKTLQELNDLVGLENVKKDINELINLLEIQKKRDNQGLKNVDISLHTVFLGPPGTGKTTVARLLGRIYKHLGYLPKGQLYETDREGLVAGYVGQTAIKTAKVLDESMGGILFVDEAYSLTQNHMGTDFGAEAVNTIIKRMEDHREDLAVVVAGYTEPMNAFIDSNPGLRSRFNRYFTFNHFSSDELILIFERFCSKYDFQLADEAKQKLKTILEAIEPLKTESFGNARVIRNIFEKAIQNQANRLIFWTAPNDYFFKTIFPEDLPNKEDILETMEKKVEIPEEEGENEEA